MSRTKSELPVDTKLSFNTIGGVPTIEIALSLTSRGQVEVVIGHLERLSNCLPETKTRKARAKSKNGPRVTRPTATEEKTV